MKKMLRLLVGSFVLLVSGTTFSLPYTQDIGKIQKLFVSADGSVAFTLSSGFKNAIADNQCPAAKDYAGLLSTADPIIKSTILAAKAAQQTITVTIIGCHVGWFKIADVYID